MEKLSESSVFIKTCDEFDKHMHAFKTLMIIKADHETTKLTTK